MSVTKNEISRCDQRRLTRHDGRSDCVWCSLVNIPDLESGERRFESYHTDQFAGIAQMVEQLICNHQVPSSILGAGTTLKACESAW